MTNEATALSESQKAFAAAIRKAISQDLPAFSRYCVLNTSWSQRPNWLTIITNSVKVLNEANVQTHLDNIAEEHNIGNIRNLNNWNTHYGPDGSYELTIIVEDHSQVDAITKSLNEALYSVHLALNSKFWKGAMRTNPNNRAGAKQHVLRMQVGCEEVGDCIKRTINSHGVSHTRLMRKGNNIFVEITPEGVEQFSRMMNKQISFISPAQITISKQNLDSSLDYDLR